jgi:hypothetical protein
VTFDPARGLLLGDSNGDRVADWMVELAGVDQLVPRDLIL